MSYKIKTIPYFDKQAKKLSKKYPSFKKDLLALINSLEENPMQGVALGNDCYKVRLSIKSKGKGKSGGARVVSYVIAVRKASYLLSVFDKSEKENISDNELQELLKMID